MYSQNMFGKRKSPYKKPTIITLILVGILGFGFWISQGNIDINKDEGMVTGAEKTINPNDDNKNEIKKAVEENRITDNLINDYYSSIGGINGPNNIDDLSAYNAENISSGALDSQMVQEASKAYYLVKEIDGFIKIYYYSPIGEEKLIRITEIPYELLSTNDQKFFTKGVIKYSIEELNELLQDFES